MFARANLVAALGGLAFALAFCFGWAWPAMFVGVAVFVVAIERSRDLGEALSAAMVFGWFGYVGGYHWLQPALAALWGDREALSWVVWLGLAFWFSLRFVVVAFAFRALRWRGCGLLVALSLPWITVEWLYPSLFPFYLANPLIDRVWLAQSVVVGGPLLLSAWSCVVSAMLAEILLWFLGGRPLSRATVGFALFFTVAALAFGARSVRTVEATLASSPTMVVGIVQGNVDVTGGRAARALAHKKYLAQSRVLEREAPVDLLVWPETAYFAPLPNRLPFSAAIVRADVEAPLLFGGVVQSSSGPSRRFNSALLADPDGNVRSAYHKRYLIPFAEYIPFGERFEAWAKVVPTLSRFQRGTPTRGVRLGSSTIAVPICYEAIRPSYVRELVRRARPDLLVTLANDGWFDDSLAPWIHLRLARMRAIEHRRYLVRATNTGISAIVDPLGRVEAQTPLLQAASLRGEVHLLRESTPYAIAGDWPGYVGLGALAWLLGRRRPMWTGRRSEQAV